MGWSKSPPTFCTGTETVVNLANTTLASDMPSLLVPHRLDAVSETAAKIPIVTAIPVEQTIPIEQTDPISSDYRAVRGLSQQVGCVQVSGSNLIQDKITGKLFESTDPVRSSDLTGNSVLNRKLQGSNPTILNRKLPGSNPKIIDIRSQN